MNNYASGEVPEVGDRVKLNNDDSKTHTVLKIYYNYFACLLYAIVDDGKIMFLCKKLNLIERRGVKTKHHPEYKQEPKDE